MKRLSKAIKCQKGRLTFQHSKFGTGVDFSHAVGGCALVDGLVPVSTQRLYAENWARAIIKFNHLRNKDTLSNIFLSSHLKFTTNLQTDRMSSKSGRSLITSLWTSSQVLSWVILLELPRLSMADIVTTIDGMGFISSCVNFFFFFF